MLFGSAAAMMATPVAGANCWDKDSYEPRHFTTCIADDCIADEMLWECISGDWSGAAFAGGFSVNCSVQTEGEEYNQSAKPYACTFMIGRYQIPSILQEQFSCTPERKGDTGCNWWPKGQVAKNF